MITVRLPSLSRETMQRLRDENHAAIAIGYRRRERRAALIVLCASGLDALLAACHGLP